MFHWCPRYAKNVCLVVRDGEHGFLSHAHFYRGKIDEFCLKRFYTVNSKLERFRMVQLVWVESAEDFLTELELNIIYYLIDIIS